MKKIILAIAILLLVNNSFSQENKYRRSSLHTILIENGNFPKKDIVISTFKNAPFPDKYNNHTIDIKNVNLDDYALDEQEKSKISVSNLNSSTSISEPSVSSEQEIQLEIEKFFKKEKIANQLVAKWYNRKTDGSFDDKLIAERGFFDADFISVNSSALANDKTSLIKASGYDLIGNTFVVVNKFNFLENEPVARLIRDLAKAEARKSLQGQPSILVDNALNAIDKVYEKTKEGYTIFAYAYLYQLEWDDTICNAFYDNMYMSDKLDIEKKNIFDRSDLFSLKFVGRESASALVSFSLKETRTENQILELSTNRIIDNVYAKLQKKYEVFKTKTPLYTGYPITAKIGRKEGLEGGEKFEVLQLTRDKNTGRDSYKQIGVVKVDKNKIWDNQFNLSENTGSIKDSAAVTTFKGGKKYISGLLIKQIK